ncbi:MAG: hypothetical protein KBT20_00955 [Bacteroidales bacterium]|nr:hypothetical protein [Candidatus Liminaster caballi]
MKALLHIFVLLIGVMLCLGIASCSDDLDTSAGAQPTPSLDTLRLGTILAGNSSQTYQLHLYNRHSREIRLSSIALRSDGGSGFRMNVDGMSGTSFTNPDLLRIAGGDSLFVFVEATFPHTSQGIVHHEDFIDITCNGQQQSVVLCADSKDVLKLEGEVLNADATWPHGLEVQVFDSLVVPEGISLILADSVTLYLHDKADIIVRGTLQCLGTQSSPVIIRGDRTDNMFPNLAYDDLPSQWGSLFITDQAKDCQFVHTDIHGMSQGIVIDSANVVFNSCRIRNSDGNLITCRMSSMQLLNCELANAAGSLLALYGGWHDIMHCTLANYNFSKQVTSEAVYMCNIDTASVRLTPLHRATFTNSIVWGSWFNPDVRPDYFRVVIDQDQTGQPVYADSIFTYRFNHCLLRADGYDDDDFISTLWNEDPLFLLTDRQNYAFDFHLSEGSPALHYGASLDTMDIHIPLDLDGNPRKTDSPSLGCYEME